MYLQLPKQPQQIHDRTIVTTRPKTWLPDRKVAETSTHHPTRSRLHPPPSWCSTCAPHKPCSPRAAARSHPPGPDASSPMRCVALDLMFKFGLHVLILFFYFYFFQSSQIKVYKKSGIDDVAKISDIVSDPNFRKDEEITFIVENQDEPVGNRENATFLVLCRNYEVYDILKTIQNVQDRFNHRYNYDWVFLNDERFDGNFITSVTSFIRGGRVSFGKVARSHWSYPDWVDLDHARHMRQQLAAKDVVYAESESYRHMCRFYSGFFYKHPLVRQYQYYWRVEPDVEFLCDIDEDPFYVMRSTGKKYGFAISMFEYSDTIPTLWTHFQTYIKGKGKSLDFVQNPDNSYNLCHFWSNFEIADVSLFDNPHYDGLFQYLDSTGGFFYERWGDAPVHTLAVSWLLEPHEIHWFDVGYHHSPYTQCPQNATFRHRNRCVCDPAADFTFTYQSCTGHFLSLVR